jgi:hydrogenase expression/formation protein HypD
MFRLRDKEISQEIISKLKQMDLDISLMHVCGTHQDTLIRYGLDSMLKETGVKIRQGPGCPVCVTTPKEIEECMALARAGKSITVFGDMVKVPSTNGTLWDLHSEGFDINIVYSVNDAINLCNKTRLETVFMGVGFETTVPSIASIIINDPPENFSVLSCHRTVPTALKAIIEMGEVKLHGLIEPGHVSTIIGVKPYEFLTDKYNIPQVIAGFEPLDLLMGVYMLAKQISNHEAKVENEYTRVVKYEGNEKALDMIREVFEPSDVKWRGFPVIPNSGLDIRKKYEKYDARKLYQDELMDLDSIEFSEPKGCKCGDVLRGVIDSDECPLFRKVCSPNNPIGPCMVSAEGSCNILFKYGK